MDSQLKLTELFFNQEFEQILEENDILIFKNKKNNGLIKISKIEFLLLQEYSKSQSITETYNIAISNNPDITFDYIISLIEKAKEIKLFINAKSVEKESEKNSEDSEAGNSIIVMYLLMGLRLFIKFLLFNRVTVRTEFIGSFRFYKVISVDISNTSFSRFIVKRSVGYIVPSILFASLLIIFYSLFGSTESIFKLTTVGGMFAKGITLNKFLSFFLIFFSIILTSFFHEIGHYFVYKQLGGKSNEFGLGLMNYFVPIIYVTTNSIYLWKGKWRKLLVSSAGIIVDLLFILVIYSLMVNQTLKEFPNINFILFLLLLALIFRTLININFLIPGTDGYFIFVDIINANNYYSSTYRDSKLVLNAFKGFDFSKIHMKHVVNLLYFTASWVSVIVTTLLFVLSVIYPLISDIIIKIFI